MDHSLRGSFRQLVADSYELILRSSRQHIRQTFKLLEIERKSLVKRDTQVACTLRESDVCSIQANFGREGIVDLHFPCLVLFNCSCHPVLHVGCNTEWTERYSWEQNKRAHLFSFLIFIIILISLFLVCFSLRLLFVPVVRCYRMTVYL